MIINISAAINKVMAENNFTHKKVKSIEVYNPKSISQLLSEMADTGFQGKSLGKTAGVWEDMLRDPDATIILGYAGSLSTTGQWKIINWLVENRFIDILVPTGANISEDIVEAMGFSYLQGSQNADDKELLYGDINRYYDVYGKKAEYLRMTELIAEFILLMRKDYNYNTREFLYLFGRWLQQKNINSIVAAAAANKVPVYCPAIVDSPYGDATLMAKARGHSIILDQAKDYTEFMSLADKVKSTGVIYIGGGVPKDFIQLLAVSSPMLNRDLKLHNRKGGMHVSIKEHYYPHKYAIQITTDSPQWGGLSGCTFDEAVSWGKIDPEGKYVQCYCDATIALPLVTHALAERVKMRRKGTDFSWLFGKG